MDAESNIARVSSTRQRIDTLARLSLRDEAIQLLEGLANLPDGADGFSWFKNSFPHVFKSVNTWLIRHWAMNTEQEDYDPSRSDDELILEYWLQPLRETLRALWRIQDTRTKEWGMVRISQDFFSQGDRNGIHVPLASPSDLLLTMKPLSRTEQLLLQFLKLAGVTRFCGNAECNAPYFVAAKRSLKYCSELCADHAQREQKRRWWAEEGKQWRSVRAKHKKSSSR